MDFKGIDFTNLTKKFELSPARLKLLGADIESGIRKRTYKGLDKNNRKMGKYKNKRYAEHKQKKYGVKYVNLKNNDIMLNAIESKLIGKNKGLRFFFGNSNERKKASANIKRGYNFFGIDYKLKSDIKEDIRNYIAKKLKR